MKTAIDISRFKYLNEILEAKNAAYSGQGLTEEDIENEGLSEEFLHQDKDELIILANEELKNIANYINDFAEELENAYNIETEVDEVLTSRSMYLKISKDGNEIAEIRFSDHEDKHSNNAFGERFDFLFSDNLFKLNKFLEDTL